MLTAAFDVGGTTLVGALFDKTGIRVRLERPTPGPVGAADPGSAGLRALALDLVAEAPGSIDGVGVGFCEYVERGRLTSTEVVAWTEQPRDWMPEIFGGARVVVESDVRCGLLAELQRGALHQVDSGVYVSWGTGISSALEIAGAIWPGARGRAIALGEFPAPGPSRLEAYASGAGMAARYARAGRPPVSARELLEAADGGDPVAVKIVDSAGGALADALAAVVRLIDPERVVLGGGLGCADHTRAHRALRNRWAELGRPADLSIAELGTDGPLIGAALAAGWGARPLSPRSGTGQR